MIIQQIYFSLCKCFILFFPRLAGMDPAGPGFESLSRVVRLNKNCAKFVDALHTNARPLTQLGFGIMQTVGKKGQGAGRGGQKWG